MRAVDAIMECLKAEGVEHVFGIPGGANLPTLDALYDAGIRHVHCRDHEQAPSMRPRDAPRRRRAGSAWRWPPRARGPRTSSPR